MVEGPGATRNGFKVKKFLHRELVNVQCSCTHSRVVDNGNDGKAWFNERILSQVFSIGKELWLIFSRMKDGQTRQETSSDDYALMLHFGMNGSLSLRSSVNPSHDRPRGAQPTLCLGFGDTMEPKASMPKGLAYEPRRVDFVELYQTTVHGPFKAVASRKKFSRLTAVDVCSTSFKSTEVLQKIKNSQPTNRIISDVILDQNIFPGVGNIIKVEALHQSGINPKQMASTIPDEKLNSLIIASRKFAMKWLHGGRAPFKKVYNQNICGTCRQVTVSIERVGDTHRTTFWCTSCQPIVPDYSKYSKDNESQPPRSIIAITNKEPIRKVCPTHGPDGIMLRRVRKGVHTGRIFYSCKVKNCNFFCWADTAFPLCKCKKRTTLLISKTQKTGGRWFFACNNRSKRCGHFSWSKPTDLEKLGERLHPLL